MKWRNLVRLVSKIGRGGKRRKGEAKNIVIVILEEKLKRKDRKKV